MFWCNLLHLKLQINFCTWKWKEWRFQQNGDTNKLYKAVVRYVCFFCAICTYLCYIKITDGGHETCGRARKLLQQASPCQLSPVPGCDGMLGLQPQGLLEHWHHQDAWGFCEITSRPREMYMWIQQKSPVYFTLYACPLSHSFLIIM